MFIDRLRVKGFKSFGLPQDLVFSPGLTAIVGPNGSGKSNLLDALRWVLGENGTQRLRIVKQSDLLFSGSASVPSSDRAEVTLSIRDREGEGNQSCSVTRCYALETGTVLTVDGMRMRLSDLQEVKRLWHLEGDQFAFISQGEVAEVIRQRPSQRRAQLETLFGIDQYRTKRNETSMKLAAAEEEGLRLGALLAELENRRQEIAGAVRRAERAKILRDRLEENRRVHYHARRFLLEEQGRSIEGDMVALGRRGDATARWLRLWTSMDDRARRENTDRAREMALLAEECDAITGRRSEFRRMCFAAASTIREIQSRFRSIRTERSAATASLGEVQRESDEILTREKGLSEESASLALRQRELEQKSSALQRELERRRREEQSARERSTALAAERDILRTKLSSRKAFLESCSRDIVKAHADMESASASVTLFKEELTLLEAREEEQREHSRAAAARSRGTIALLQRTRKEQHLLEERYEDLQARESSSYPEPVRFLVSAARLGKTAIPMMVALESFTCPPRIASALEAYLGGRQHWVFVRTTEDAGRLIDMLKRQPMGRVTFLPLDRARPRSPDRRTFLPGHGVVGWADDLIVADREWNDAVRHILGDLLLLEGYDTGAELVRKKAPFPMVTLDGEVFAPSGTISGGRSKSAGGAIERRHQIRAVGEQLSASRQEVERLTGQLADEERLEQESLAERERRTVATAEKRNALREAERARAFEMERSLRLKEEEARCSAEIESGERALASLEEEIQALSQGQTSGPGTEEGSDILAHLDEVTRQAALAEERLSSVRAVQSRVQGEMARWAERVRLLEDEEAQVLRREADEKKKLSLWGKEQLGLVTQYGEKMSALTALRTGEAAAERRLDRLTARLKAAASAANADREALETVLRRKEAIEQELRQIIDLWEDQFPYGGASPCSERDGEAVAATCRRLEREFKALGDVDWGALSEDQSLAKRTAFLSAQLDDAKNAIVELKGILADTDRTVGALFVDAMTSINRTFDALFRRLFDGGEARLRMQDTGDDDDAPPSAPWDRGVEIVARPPGKHLQNLAQLSGGEQTLTAIAHLFASMEVAGVPLAVLDEVDASLDEPNLLRFGELAREYAAGRGLQLIVMTHRRATMERADVLYGVTLDEPGLSKALGLQMSEWTGEEREEP